MTVTNWNATATCDPAREITPSSLEELVSVVKNPAYPSPVRAVGSLHSLNPCMTTDGTVVQMKTTPFQSIGTPADGTVTVGAGVTMFDLKNALRPYGLQIAVTPEIGNATAGSVACCGTKDASLMQGSGEAPGQISSTVMGVKMVNARGEIEEVTEAADPSRMRIIRSSYGLLGIVYEVTFATCPLQIVSYKPEALPLTNLTLAQALGPASGFLGFLFPYHDTLVVERRTLDPGSEPTPLDDFKRATRNRLWRAGGYPFAEDPVAFDKGFNAFFPLLSFRSYRVDVMIDFKPGGGHFFDFGFWAFPVSSWGPVIPKYVDFCQQFLTDPAYQFRPALPTEVYYIKQDRKALLSFSSEEDIFTLDMVHLLHRPASPDERLWDEMNRRFNEFAAEYRARPLLNQTKQLSKSVVMRTLGADWQTFSAERLNADPDGRFLSRYFKDLL